MSKPNNTFANFSSWLGDAHRPIYAIDASRRIIFSNAVLLRWVEKTSDEVLGSYVEYHSEREPDSTQDTSDTGSPLFGLCPPPEAFSGIETLGTVTSTDSNGRLVHRSGRFVPILDIEFEEAEESTQTTNVPEIYGVLAILEVEDKDPHELLGDSRVSWNDQLHLSIRRFRKTQATKFAIPSLLGVSSSMQKVRTQVRMAADCDANVLIVGQHGSGREWIAKTIHYESTRTSEGVLIPLEGALLTRDVLRRSVGRLGDTSQANTLLITDVDQLECDIAETLAELAIQNGNSFRVIGTSSQSEQGLNEKGETASEVLHDLLNSLSTVLIRVPRLVDRLEDLPQLAQFFVESCNRGSEKQVGGIQQVALDRLALYQWPGEVEELRQVVELAHTACSGNYIDLADFPPVIHHAASAAVRPKKQTEEIVLDDFLAKVERELIHRALGEAGGNKTEAARLLGVNRPRLYRRLLQLGFVDESEEK